ncbi:hypothetical protein Tco_0607202, partial [Tanacetum coccineum]
RYLKHPIKLLYSVELTMVPSAVFTSLVPPDCVTSMPRWLAPVRIS